MKKALEDETLPEIRAALSVIRSKRAFMAECQAHIDQVTGVQFPATYLAWRDAEGQELKEVERKLERLRRGEII